MISQLIPLTGQTYISRNIVSSKYLNNRFDLDILPVNFEANISKMGKFTLKKLLLFLIYLIETIKRILKNNYDLIYYTPAFSNFFCSLRDSIYILTLKLFNKKMILHFHTFFYKNIRKNSFLYKMVRFLIHNCYSILLSPLISNDIVTKNVRGNYFLIYGIPKFIQDEEVYSAIELRRKKRESHILFLSLLKYEKGIFYALELAYLLKKDRLKPKFIFAGSFISEREKDKFFSLAKRFGVLEDIELKGWVDGDIKKEVLLSCDIFIFPSIFRFEILGIVTLEAMQAGLPVVTFDIGAIREIIEDGVNGFVVPRGDVFKMAEKTSLLINNKDFAIEMGIRARKKFLERFNFERYEKELADIFESIINKQ